MGRPPTGPEPGPTINQVASDGDLEAFKAAFPRITAGLAFDDSVRQFEAKLPGETLSPADAMTLFADGRASATLQRHRPALNSIYRRILNQRAADDIDGLVAQGFTEMTTLTQKAFHVAIRAVLEAELEELVHPRFDPAQVLPRKYVGPCGGHLEQIIDPRTRRSMLADGPFAATFNFFDPVNDSYNHILGDVDMWHELDRPATSLGILYPSFRWILKARTAAADPARRLPANPQPNGPAALQDNLDAARLGMLWAGGTFDQLMAPATDLPAN